MQMRLLTVLRDLLNPSSTDDKSELIVEPARNYLDFVTQIHCVEKQSTTDEWSAEPTLDLANTLVVVLAYIRHQIRLIQEVSTILIEHPAERVGEPQGYTN